jgi:hypothetical protein
MNPQACMTTPRETSSGVIQMYMHSGRSTPKNNFQNAKHVDVDGGRLVSSYQMPSPDTLLSTFSIQAPTEHVLLTDDDILAARNK